MVNDKKRSQQICGDKDEIEKQNHKGEKSD